MTEGIRAVMEERKKVWREKSSLGYFDFRTLSDIRKHINEQIEFYGPDAEVREVSGWGNGEKYLAIGVYEPENDKEYEMRKKSETENAEFRRKQYEQLKKEFEK